MGNELFLYELITYKKKCTKLKYHNYTWKFSTHFRLVVNLSCLFIFTKHSKFFSQYKTIYLYRVTIFLDLFFSFLCLPNSSLSRNTHMYIYSHTHTYPSTMACILTLSFFLYFFLNSIFLSKLYLLIKCTGYIKGMVEFFFKAFKS